MVSADMPCCMFKLTLGLDKDKKKYFKIQPDHLVPAGAKHSQTRVKLAREEKAVGQPYYESNECCYCLLYT